MIDKIKIIEHVQQKKSRFDIDKYLQKKREMLDVYHTDQLAMWRRIQLHFIDKYYVCVFVVYTNKQIDCL